MKIQSTKNSLSLLLLNRPTAALALLLLVGASACGGVSYREVPGSSTTPSSSSSGDTSGSGSDSGYTDTSFDDDTTISEEEEDGSYTITSSFKIAGPKASSGSSYTRSGISTDNVLRVTVTGGQPTTIASGSYTAQYSCMRVTVTVGSDTQEAFVTNTGSDGTGSCAGAKSSETLDFSGSLTPGHGSVSVKVSEAQYDNCSNQWPWYNIAMSGCALHDVYTYGTSASHYVQGRLSVEVNSPAL